MNSKISLKNSFRLLIVFIIIKFVLFKEALLLGAYTSYYAELVYIFLSLFIFRKYINFKLIPDRFWAINAVSSLGVGFFIFQFAYLKGILIPFEFNHQETIVLLLIVAPVLEEFLFRFMLLEALSSKIQKQSVLIFISALIFSATNFKAYWLIGCIYHNFIFYQTAYTLVLGLWWARET